jgi:hypothetical protein
VNAPAIRIAGHTAFEAAALAAAKLTGVVWRSSSAAIETRRQDMIAALERISEAGLTTTWLGWWLDSLRDDETWRADWTSESEGLIQVLGELLALDEAVGAGNDQSRFCWAGRHGRCPGASSQPDGCRCACHAAVDPAPATPRSAPTIPPPSSGDGSEIALELDAAYSATAGLPANDGAELPELPGAPTEPCGMACWDDAPTYVPA